MRDSDYFNDKLYFFGNAELKEKLKVLAKKKQTKMYVIIDEAIRKHLKDEGVEFELKPKVPTLI